MCRPWLLGICASAVCLTATIAHAQVRYSFDIPAEDMASALRSFSAVSNTQVLFDGAIVRNVKNSALVGDFTPVEGLKALLAGSKLTSRTTSSGVILIGLGDIQSPRPDNLQKNLPPLPEEDTVIVVTGFRGSLQRALDTKKHNAGMVDSILAEDIAKFPDSNLAESMQRIPGVTLSRGDGGEGRNISVRGLGPVFTRVRINGMEAVSQTGSSDIYGAGNNGRSFDFNVFPTEIFSSLSARKTASADTEEGSLGATVDLRAPRPSDYHADSVFSLTAKDVYNPLSAKADPRISLQVARKFMGGQFAVLGSLTYQERHIREVGYSAVDILSANTNGLLQGDTVLPFCTPLEYSLQSPSPMAQADKGASLTNCSTNNPRTGSLDAFNTIVNLRRTDLPDVAGSGAFFPRLPRYLNSQQNAQRLGGTVTLQWRPESDTEATLDLLYSKYHVERRDNYIEALSFARNANSNGQPMVSVKDVQFSPQGSLIYGLFDGVDVRSEGLVDDFTTTDAQANVEVAHRFSDRFSMTAYLGGSNSDWNGPLRLQTFMDAINTKNVSIDYRDGGKTPILNFGMDVNNPANFSYAPALVDGTVLGGFTLQGKPQYNRTVNLTGNLDGRWTANSAIAVKFGTQFRINDFTSYNLNPIPALTAVKALPAGVTLASLTTYITGLDRLWGRGAPASWVAIDPEKWAKAFGLDTFTYCGVECGASSSEIREAISAGYVMVEFNTKILPQMPVRGNIGLRYVDTNQLSVGYIPVTAATGSPYPITGQRNEVRRAYDDWLPSINLVFEFTPNLLGRFSAAKVMARPELSSLAPSSAVNTISRVGNVNNPFLEPVRAQTLDLSLEWYFQPGSLVTFAYFHKDISSFIQKVNTQVPFNQLGLPTSLLDNSGTLPTDIFTVSRTSNTPGGPLEGVELDLQTELKSLPGFWKNLGILANYTYVDSAINYILASSNGVTAASTTSDLTGLSRNSGSATLYYEDNRFSLRATGTYRGKYIRSIPASPGSDLQGNASTFYLDASGSIKFGKNLKFIVELQNLTDEQNRLYIDSGRQDTLFDTRIGRTVTLGLNYRY